MLKDVGLHYKMGALAKDNAKVDAKVDALDNQVKALDSKMNAIMDLLTKKEE